MDLRELVYATDRIDLCRNRFSTYDEVKRLGLNEKSEQRVRNIFPDASGLLTVR